MDPAAGFRRRLRDLTLDRSDGSDAKDSSEEDPSRPTTTLLTGTPVRHQTGSVTLELFLAHLPDGSGRKDHSGSFRIAKDG